MIFWLVVLLSLIVVIHEGGHYLAARAFGVRVLEFMVGLPGPSVGFKPKRSRTRFGVTAVPLGGYARIAGMDEWRDETNVARAAAFLYKIGSIDPDDIPRASEVLGFDLEENLLALAEWGTVIKKKVARNEYSFHAPEIDGFELGEPRTINNPVAFIDHERSQTYIALPWWKRMIILFAGPGANLLTAIVVVTLVLTCVGTVEITPTLSEVSEGGPAAAAGISAGDTIVAFDGQPVESWDEFRVAMGSVEPGETVEVTYTRDGETVTVPVTTEYSETLDGAVIGVTAGYQEKHWSVPEALGESFSYIGQVTVAIGKLLWPATTMETVSQSTSLVGIAVVAKQAAELGAANFFWLIAVLSISIGLMNLLPLMPLDGGRMVVETVQRLRRKVLSPAAVNGYTVAGICLVMLLFVVVTTQDIGNLATGNFPF